MCILQHIIYIYVYYLCIKLLDWTIDVPYFVSYFLRFFLQSESWTCFMARESFVGLNSKFPTYNVFTSNVATVSTKTEQVAIVCFWRRERYNFISPADLQLLLHGTKRNPLRIFISHVNRKLATSSSRLMSACLCSLAICKKWSIQ